MRLTLIFVSLAVLLTGCRMSPLAPETQPIPKPFAVADTLGNSGTYVRDVEYRVWLTPDALVLAARWDASIGHYTAYNEPGENAWWITGSVINNNGEEIQFSSVGRDYDEPYAPIAMDAGTYSFAMRIPCIVTQHNFRLELPRSLLGPAPYYYTLEIGQQREGPRGVDPIDPLRGIAVPNEGPLPIAALDDLDPIEVGLERD